MLLGDQGWSAICRSDDRAGRRRPGQGEICLVRATWGQTLAAGQADAALCWEGLRAQWEAERARFRLHPRQGLVEVSRKLLPNPSLRLRGRLASRTSTPTTSSGWAMGLEFGYQNPRAATQITMEVPELTKALNDTFKDKNVAVESMWQLQTVYRGNWANPPRLGLARSRFLEHLPRPLSRTSASSPKRSRPRTSSRTTSSPVEMTSITRRSRQMRAGFQLAGVTSLARSIRRRRRLHRR